MDILGIIGFIIFIIIKAMGESNRKKREYTKRASRLPKAPLPAETKGPVPKSFEEIFPTVITLPWEEVIKEEYSGSGKWEEPSAEEISREGSGEEEYLKQGSLEDSATEGYVRPDYEAAVPELSKITPGQEKPLLKPVYSLALTTEQIWHGIVWSEILQPPKALKGRFR
jgi:hypothetical protein